jgi:GT2 family glycosyltransferase
MTETAVCPVSAIVPACRRKERLLETLRRIRACRPAPAEILVHVDGGDVEIVAAVEAFDPAIRVLTSEKLLGPGGSRNQLIAAAKNELVANFDDDSFPSHDDYFARVMQLAERFPEAAMFSAASQEKEWRSPQFQRIAVPSGCGCVFRKSWFERTQGFVPLPVAYNMEEVDIGLQLHAMGGVIVHDPLLRVVHEHVLEREINADINAQVLANTALFPFLRFPVWLWPVGAWSVLWRMLRLLAWGWTAGLLEGLRMIPDHLQRHKQFRREVVSPSLLSWLWLKRWPKDLGDATPEGTGEGDRSRP